MKIYITMLFLMVLSLTTYGQKYDSVAFKIELNELTIIGSIRADENTPVTEKTLNIEYIETRYRTQEVPLFLALTPSVISYSDAGSFAGYSYWRLRGIDNTRINSTLNGIPLNEPEDQGTSEEELIKLSDHPKVVAIGETGLDYFRSEGDVEWQRERFRQHIRAAKQVNKPII